MTARQQKWNRDTEIEQMASEFLDENFYSIFYSKASVERYTDTYHQFGGVDIRINSTNFDEKCKCYGCLNQVQQYVGLECTLLNKAGMLQDGWFFNNKLSTDYYAFIGLSAEVQNIKYLSSSGQITSADVLWVKKDDIIYFIENHMTLDVLALNVSQLRVESDSIESDENGFFSSLPDCLGYRKPSDGKYRFKYGHGLFWLTYSTHMHEKPVNLVFPRCLLESFPHSRHFIVARGKSFKVIETCNN